MVLFTRTESHLRVKRRPGQRRRAEVSSRPPHLRRLLLTPSFHSETSQKINEIFNISAKYLGPCKGDEKIYIKKR